MKFLRTIVFIFSIFSFSMFFNISSVVEDVAVVSNQRNKPILITQKISNGSRSASETVKNVALAVAPVVGEAIADGFESGFRELAQECFRANREAEEQLQNPYEFLRNQMSDIDPVALDHTFTPLRNQIKFDYSSYTKEQKEVSGKILIVDSKIESIYSDINKYGYSEWSGLRSKEYLNNVCRVSHDVLDLAMSFCNENHLDIARNLTNFSTVLLDSAKASMNILKGIESGFVDGGQDFIDRYRGNPSLLFSDVGYATTDVIFPELMFVKFIFGLARQGYLVLSDFSSYKRVALRKYSNFSNLSFEDKAFISSKIATGFFIKNLVYKKNFKLVRKTKGFLRSLNKFVEEESKIVKSVSRTLKLKDEVIKKALSPIGSAIKGSGSNVGVMANYGVKNSQNALGVIIRNPVLSTLEDSLFKNLELILLNRKWNMKDLIYVCNGNFGKCGANRFGLVSGMHTEKAFQCFLRVCKINKSELIISKLRNGVKIVKIPKKFVNKKSRGMHRERINGEWFYIKTLWPKNYNPKDILIKSQDILRQGVNAVDEHGRSTLNKFIGTTSDGINVAVVIDSISGFIKTTYPILD